MPCSEGSEGVSRSKAISKPRHWHLPWKVQEAKLIGAGAATIALAGAAIGIGNVSSALIDSVSRNPSLA